MCKKLTHVNDPGHTTQIILSVLILVVCVTDLQAFWSRSSSSSSGTGSSSSSSSSGTGSSFSYDLNKKGLTNLYNSKVTKVESYSRPVDSWLGNLGIKHTGVVATNSNGHRWLVHKGDEFGILSSTVVTDAKHMSDGWKKTGTKDAKGHTISDVMKAGHANKPYGILPGKNLCWGASKNIMKTIGK